MKTGIGLDEKRFSNMSMTWRHYLIQIYVKIKKNWYNYWKFLNKQFQHVSKTWEAIGAV